MRARVRVRVRVRVSVRVRVRVTVRVRVRARARRAPLLLARPLLARVALERVERRGGLVDGRDGTLARALGGARREQLQPSRGRAPVGQPRLVPCGAGSAAARELLGCERAALRAAGERVVEETNVCEACVVLGDVALALLLVLGERRHHQGRRRPFAPEVCFLAGKCAAQDAAPPGTAAAGA